jgi:hypothetical protein
MSNLFKVGHGINVQGIFEVEEDANKAANSLPSVTINDTVVKATVMEVSGDKYVIDRDAKIVIEKKGGNTAHLNDTAENNKW